MIYSIKCFSHLITKWCLKFSTARFLLLRLRGSSIDVTRFSEITIVFQLKCGKVVRKIKTLRETIIGQNCVKSCVISLRNFFLSLMLLQIFRKSRHLHKFFQSQFLFMAGTSLNLFWTFWITQCESVRLFNKWKSRYYRKSEMQDTLFGKSTDKIEPSWYANSVLIIQICQFSIKNFVGITTIFVYISALDINRLNMV